MRYHRTQLNHMFLLLSSLLWSCGPDLPRDIAVAYRKLPQEIDFNFHVRPILSDHCFACHGPDAKARKADLRLDLEATALGVLAEGTGHAFKPGDVQSSTAIERILTTQPKLVMPPPQAKMELTPVDKATLVKWVKQGAVWKDHWSFLPIIRPDLPPVRNEKLVNNPIDRFVLAKLENRRLSFSQAASKETLIRRLSFDLTGLPPHPEQVNAFLTDNSIHAYERVVDQLLDSPSFGERWAWEWLDAARYADTNGFQGDPERDMWPWRDWVIEAINKNMPYDQFTIEQLAGDRLPSPTTGQLIATAFNRNHMYNGEGGRIPEETRVENVFDRVETVGTIWMGLTFNCCRCHDHKYDQLSQREYYQLYDYFNQTSEDGHNGDGHIEPVLNLSPPEEREKIAELEKFVEAVADEVAAYEKRKFPHDEGQTAADSPAAVNLNGDDRFGLTFAPNERNSYLTGLLSRTFEEKDPYYSTLLGDLREARNKKNREARHHTRVMIMDEIPRLRPTFILDRGSYDQQLERVSRNVPEILPALPDDGINNRLTLAHWLVSPEHPLTARVTVNRYWQAFFGTGLVKTVDDFGVQGEKPSHPDLMDWLAAELMESGWDLKHLFKTIVMSSTYRQSSKASPELIEVDPENRLLARATRFRLPSWMIRDQALALSGLLVDSTGGPPVKPYQPEGLWEEATFGKTKYRQDHGDDLYRRSIYTFWRRIAGPPGFFDNSPRQTCSVKTLRTNSPLHALTTFNDITFAEAARVMAVRVIQHSNDREKRLQWAFRLATSRLPGPAEQEILSDRLTQLLKTYEAAPEAAGQLISIGEHPVNGESPVAEQAAYTAICSLLLNLDETITRQ